MWPGSRTMKAKSHTDSLLTFTSSARFVDCRFVFSVQMLDCFMIGQQLAQLRERNSGHQ